MRLISDSFLAAQIIQYRGKYSERKNISKERDVNKGETQRKQKWNANGQKKQEQQSRK